MTKVKFLIEMDSEDEVFAFFPEIKQTDDGWACYSHIGQHCTCGYIYADSCKEAITNEYLPLLAELIGQGYKDLKIENKQFIEYYRQPTKEEIKFGEGARHYRSFTLSETGVTKTGDLKKWFVADDGLRYYR